MSTIAIAGLVNIQIDKSENNQPYKLLMRSGKQTNAFPYSAQCVVYAF